MYPMRGRAILVLLGITALGAYSVGHQSAPVSYVPVSAPSVTSRAVAKPVAFTSPAAPVATSAPFAKVGPMLRMQSVIEESRSRGMKIEAIFGVDQQGTSAQALRFALDRFDNVYIIREPNLTFH